MALVLGFGLSGAPGRLAWLTTAPGSLTFSLAMSARTWRYGAPWSCRLRSVDWASAWAGLLTGACARRFVASTIWALIGFSAALALAILASRFFVASPVLYCR